ncbi:MAG: LysR family transcriptional regulator [Kocuria rhizophila]|nr:MAG: LysR family transcriptional regulator [Kocuria rhizophila]
MVNYTLRQLEYFVTVSQLGSIAGAADKLHVSASAIASSLTDLERALDAQLLLRRRSHGVALTSSGREIFSRALNLLREASELGRVETLDETLPGTLRLGSYSTLGPTVLAELLGNYAQQHPLVDLDFRIGSQAELFHELQTGTIDAALVYAFSLPFDLGILPLKRLPHTVVMSENHRLARKESISIHDLADEPLILLDVYPSRENTMSLFEQAGVQPRIRFRATDYEVTRSLVGKELGCAILIQHPHGDFTWTGRELTVRPLKSQAPPVEICLVWNKSIRMNPPTIACVELAKSLFSNENQDDPS